MTLAEIAQYVLTAIITGAPITVAIGMLGTGIEKVGAARGWPKVERAGQFLEALFSDLPKAIRGSRATKLQAEIELLKGSGPKTPRTGSVPPSAAGLLLLAGALALSPALPACSSSATPEARGVQAVDVVRASLNTGAAIVGALDTVNAAWMDAVTATGDPALAAAAVPAGRKATEAVNAGYAALAKAQAALDGGDEAGARAYLVEALGYADIVLSLLDTGGQGNRVPKASRDALGFLRGVAARWAGGAS
jgi:hypothetical protein